MVPFDANPLLVLQGAATIMTEDHVTALNAVPRYALVFKTHVWDNFIERQYNRFRQCMTNGDLFVALDETNAKSDCIPGQTMRFTQAELIEMGLADRAERGSLIWWNTDYPHYLFYKNHSDYDFYIFCEYDTCICRDIDTLIQEVAAASAEFVALPTRVAKEEWMWTAFHLPTYGEKLAGSLNCISIFSNRALKLLSNRRLEMSSLSKKGGVPFWPTNEVFIATEIKRAGLKMMSLDDFGSAEGYEWYPPHLEDDITTEALVASAHNGRPRVFLHPVLDRPRFMASLLKFSPLQGYLAGLIQFRPLYNLVTRRTRLGRELRRFPEFSDRVPKAFARRVAVRARERFEHMVARARVAVTRPIDRSMG